jgi:hypothetical protein
MRYIIFLIILAAFASADVVVQGASGVPGYLTADDTPTVTILTELAGNPSLEQATSRVTHTGKSATSCVREGFLYKCTWKGVSLQDDYVIQIVDGDGQELRVTSGIALVDTQAPFITSARQGAGGLVVTVEDYALSAGDTRTCSGVSSIQVSGGEVYPIEGTPCRSTITIPVTIEGLVEYCVRAKDALGQLSQEVCAPVVTDTQGPVVTKIGYATYEGVFLSGIEGSRELYPAVKLQDTSKIVQLKVVKGDKELRRAKQQDGIYFFTPEQVNARDPCQLTITAVDEHGYSTTGDYDCSLTTDTEGPKYIRAITGAQKNRLPVIGGVSDIVLVFRELGLSRSKVSIDTSAQGGGIILSNGCDKVEDQWYCAFENVVSTVAGEGQILIRAEDDLGQETRDVEVLFTNLDAPRIQSISNTPRLLQVGQDAHFSLQVQSTTQPTIRVDQTKIAADSPKQELCEIENSQGSWVCTLTLEEITTYNGSDRLTFVVTDSSGNSHRTEHGVIVLPSNAELGELHKILSVVTIPKTIDPDLASRIPYPLTAQLRLRGKGEIVDSVVSCNQDLLRKSPELLFGKTSPTVSLILQKGAHEKASAVNCTLQLISTYQGRAVQETIPFTVPLREGTPILGSMVDSVEQRLATINYDIGRIQKDIEKWEKINKALGSVRDVAQLAAQVDASMSFMTGAIWGAMSALYKTALGSIIAVPVWQATCGAYVGTAGVPGLHYLINVAIWLPGHQPGTVLLPTPKSAALIASCQLCSFSGVLEAEVPESSGSTLVSLDGSEGKPTKFAGAVVNNWEPFRSMHVAQACFCPSAIEYNLRKERQLRCIYKNCIKESTALGLPIDHCDKTLLEQNCLYVDGAAWKVAGGNKVAQLLRQVATTLLGRTPLALAGAAWTIMCNPFYSVQGQLAYNCIASGRFQDPFFDFMVPACGVWGGILELAETDFFGENKFGWDTLNGQLAGEDFCA